MRKILMKKITAVTLAMSMVIGSASIVSAAHAANGANVATSGKWSSFSVCDVVNGQKTEWAIALEEEIQKKIKQVEADYAAGRITDAEYKAGLEEADSYKSYTEGYFVSNPNVADAVSFYVKNSGWDGQYNDKGKLVGDNPYGLHFELKGIPVEKGRSYTISFNIKSTLSTTKELKDDDGNPILDGSSQPMKETVSQKHAFFKAYDPVSKGEPKVEFDSISGAELDGSLILDSTKAEGQNITCKVTIPKTYGGTSMGIMFTLGAYLNSYPDEIGMKGQVDISNLKVIAGHQYKVSFTGNGKTYATYVNKGARASISSSTSMKLGKKNYTIDYYTLGGAKYDFTKGVTKDITLKAHYVKTKKPAAPKIKSAKSPSKKKVKVVLKGAAKNAVGYEYKYSKKSNMKGAKSKKTKKTSLTIKKLKSGSFVYIQVRGYNLDSLGNKVYGKWSKKKTAVVR